MYLGCEGESEAAYGQMLDDLLRSAGLAVHLRVDVLAPGAGDPLTRVRRAADRIARIEKQRVRFHARAILMDSDRVAGEHHRTAEAANLAARSGIQIIWQAPCHEALLLRHMPGCEGRRPPTCPAAERALKQIWPEYQKPMTRMSLARRINSEGVRRAARVEPELLAFLRNIGLFA
jgi:hypothetical protein